MLITLTGNLSWLYTSDIKRLWLRVFLIFMIRTMAASIWYWRSWKTLSVVLACSSTWKKTIGLKKITTRVKGPWGEDPRWNSYRLFHLDLVYFDPEELVFKVIIARKLVSVLYVFAFWDFGEYTCFSAGEWLQSPAQLTVLCEEKKKKRKKSHTGFRSVMLHDEYRMNTLFLRPTTHLFLLPVWSPPGWTPRLR